MKLKKSGLSILTLALIASNLIVANAQSLSDIDNHWAKSTIEKFVNQGYISGYNDETFKPNQNMTRAEFVKTFNKVFGITNKSNKVFEDTKNHWAKNEIDIAVTNGVCNGVSETQFNPNGQITREETSVMLSNYKKISDSNLNKIGVFNDKDDISNWAKNSVEGVLEEGYMGGYPDGDFKPKKPITRAEAVITLDRVVNQNTTTTNPEPSDGMKLPTINYAKELNIKYPYTSGGSGNMADGGNEIVGDLYVKYGDTTSDPVGGVGAFMHTYGCGSQEQYDKVLAHVKGALKTINYRNEPEWVYMQYFINGGKIDSFVDPILKQKGINTTYGQWKNNNKTLISYVNSGKVSKADAEKTAMFNSTVAHVERNTPGAKDVGDDSSVVSAYQRIFGGITDRDATGQFKLLIADILGVNGMIAGDTSYNVTFCLPVGQYWFRNGKDIQIMSNTTKPMTTDKDPVWGLNAVYELPSLRNWK